MGQYTVIATNLNGTIHTLGTIVAPDEQSALIEFGKLVREKMSDIDPDAMVSISGPDGGNIGAPSALSEHVKRD